MNGYDWLYRTNDDVTHAHKTDRHTTISAVCGISTYTHWYGQGRPLEQQAKAAAMPKCEQCLKLIGN